MSIMSRIFIKAYWNRRNWSSKNKTRKSNGWKM